MVPAAGPSPAEPLKDLTPPGFADLIPPPAEHAGGEGGVRPVAREGRGLFAGAEYLLLRPASDGFDYAVRNRIAGLATDGPVEALRYRLGNGFRVELGYRFPDGRLDVSAAYTRLRAFADGTVGAGPGQVLFPTRTRPSLTDAALTAAASADLEYNLYDLLVGRRFEVDDHLAVRGFAGVRFADVRQTMTVRYDGLDARGAGVHSNTRFEGAGPLVGAEVVLGGWRGFHLYARGSGGLLSGPVATAYQNSNDDGRTVYADLPYTVRKVVPVAGLGVGGGWAGRTVSVRVGYEVTHWFGLTDRVRLTGEAAQGALIATPGSLSLEGLFVQLGIAF